MVPARYGSIFCKILKSRYVYQQGKNAEPNTRHRFFQIVHPQAFYDYYKNMPMPAGSCWQVNVLPRSMILSLRLRVGSFRCLSRSKHASIQSISELHLVELIRNA